MLCVSLTGELDGYEKLIFSFWYSFREEPINERRIVAIGLSLKSWTLVISMYFIMRILWWEWIAFYLKKATIFVIKAIKF